MNASEIKGQVDFGIITIREDEFKAVLKRFPKPITAKGRRWYNVSEVAARNGEIYRTAVVRCLEQGNSEAQSVATDLIEELDPQWILVVGIAGGMPDNELSLGDVVASTRIYDFSVGAVKSDGTREYSMGGGPIHPAVGPVVANLHAMDEDLGEWSSAASIIEATPAVDMEAIERSRQAYLYGNEHWQAKTLGALKAHFDERGAARRRPIVTAGPIASSDVVLKNADVANDWLQSARSIVAVEMESAGVYRVAHHRAVPALAIRGISDIVGLARDPRWTAYACHTAAAFARAFVGAGPIESRAGRGSASPADRATPVPARITPVPTKSAPTPARGTPMATPPMRRASPAPTGRAPERPPFPYQSHEAARAAASQSEPRAPAARREKVFISFVEQDRETLAALKEALKPIEQQGLISTWDATQIRPGEVIAEKTRAAIASAKVAVLLVSSKFLASQAHEREVSALLSAGVRLLCLYVDFSLVDLASYAYIDPQTRAQTRIKLVELGALNDPERPLRSLSASEKGATLMRSVKMIIEAASAQE